MASSIAEVLGLSCLTVAAFLIAAPLGWAVAGVALLLIGQALDGVDSAEAARRAVSTVCGQRRRTADTERGES
ncbi:hypothetical protein KGQ19_18240 [Catenulispora sp. NL8]|uniref:Uncharacterized protein n=1 Tax=Catenulispora pinistramenti TaxID=2705254 RepID=A0ABS5KRZ7_9ACTN|nr:hypothetical protein [Catenulispora pinistramenti]MBS2548809.1 hypothetical protein [Catenulispora pinistramenti]